MQGRDKGRAHIERVVAYLVEYVSEPVHGQRLRVVDDVRLPRGHERDADGVQPADGARRAHSFVVHVHAQAVQHLPSVVRARSLGARHQQLTVVAVACR